MNRFSGWLVVTDCRFLSLLSHYLPPCSQYAAGPVHRLTPFAALTGGALGQFPLLRPSCPRVQHRYWPCESWLFANGWNQLRFWSPSQRHCRVISAIRVPSISTSFRCFSSSHSVLHGSIIPFLLLHIYPGSLHQFYCWLRICTSHVIPSFTVSTYRWWFWSCSRIHMHMDAMNTLKRKLTVCRTVR